MKEEFKVKIRNVLDAGFTKAIQRELIFELFDEAIEALRTLTCSEHGKVKAQPACPNCLALLLKAREK